MTGPFKPEDFRSLHSTRLGFGASLIEAAAEIANEAYARFHPAVGDEFPEALAIEVTINNQWAIECDDCGSLLPDTKAFVRGGRWAWSLARSRQDARSPGKMYVTKRGQHIRVLGVVCKQCGHDNDLTDLEIDETQDARVAELVRALRHSLSWGESMYGCLVAGHKDDINWTAIEEARRTLAEYEAGNGK